MSLFIINDNLPLINTFNTVTTFTATIAAATTAVLHLLLPYLRLVTSTNTFVTVISLSSADNL